MKHFDTIVIGQGAMGSAAALALAERGQQVLGLEQFHLVHHQGSSHGHSRIIREVYYEHPAYVPLAQQAFQHWETIERAAKQPLLTRCRCANIGTSASEIIQGVQRAAQEHQLPYARWNAAELRRHMPALHVPDNMMAIVEERAGWLKVEQCVRSMQQLATAAGATLYENEKVVSWKSEKAHVEVTTLHGRYQAERLVLAAGPWAGSILAEWGVALRVMRQMQLWFTAPEQHADNFRMQHLPIFIIDTPEGHFYGIPSEAGPGVKIAQHYSAPELSSPEEVDRTYRETDLLPVRRFLQRYLPSLADAPLAEQATCIYTLSPDRHFVVDLHPVHANVAIACGFSGHGFKFAPVIGTMLADLLEGKRHEATSQLFSIERLAR